MSSRCLRDPLFLRLQLEALFLKDSNEYHASEDYGAQGFFAPGATTANANANEYDDNDNNDGDNNNDDNDDEDPHHNDDEVDHATPTDTTTATSTTPSAPLHQWLCGLTPEEKDAIQPLHVLMSAYEYHHTASKITVPSLERLFEYLMTVHQADPLAADQHGRTPLFRAALCKVPLGNARFQLDPHLHPQLRLLLSNDIQTVEQICSDAPRQTRARLVFTLLFPHIMGLSHHVAALYIAIRYAGPASVCHDTASLSNGNTMLHCALMVMRSSRSCRRIVQALLDGGADPTRRNALRQTPLDIWVTTCAKWQLPRSSSVRHTPACLIAKAKAWRSERIRVVMLCLHRRARAQCALSKLGAELLFSSVLTPHLGYALPSSSSQQQ